MVLSKYGAVVCSRVMDYGGLHRPNNVSKVLCWGMYQSLVNLHLSLRSSSPDSILTIILSCTNIYLRFASLGSLFDSSVSSLSFFSFAFSTLTGRKHFPASSR